METPMDDDHEQKERRKTWVRDLILCALFALIMLVTICVRVFFLSDEESPLILTPGSILELVAGLSFAFIVLTLCIYLALRFAEKDDRRKALELARYLEHPAFEIRDPGTGTQKKLSHDLLRVILFSLCLTIGFITFFLFVERVERFDPYPSSWLAIVSPEASCFILLVSSCYIALFFVANDRWWRKK
jgi:hypothetical protein